MREHPYAKFLPKYPADRGPNPEHVRVEKNNVHIPFKFPNWIYFNLIYLNIKNG